MKTKIVTFAIASMAVFSTSVFADNHNAKGKETKEAAKSSTAQPVKSKKMATIFDASGKELLVITEENLKDFPEMNFTLSKTPWYKEPIKAKGISFKAVLEKAGVKPTDKLTMIAWDKYTTEVPASDAFSFNTMLATHINGQKLTLKDKGPLFHLYPFDDNKMLAEKQEYSNKSVWAIKEIRVTK